MKGLSILWISSSGDRHTDATLEQMRAAGLLPVRVGSVERALHILRQFRVSAVVVHADDAGRDDCARLADAGAPVAVRLRAAAGDTVAPYLQAGCAAVISESCPAQMFVAKLRLVSAGERDVVWPTIQRSASGAFRLEPTR
jgi:hypothetical protein